MILLFFRHCFSRPSVLDDLQLATEFTFRTFSSRCLVDFDQRYILYRARTERWPDGSPTHNHIRMLSIILRFVVIYDFLSQQPTHATIMTIVFFFVSCNNKCRKKFQHMHTQYAYSYSVYKSMCLYML